MDLYVCGHGGWEVVGRPTVFVPLPAGSEVVLYHEVGETMSVPEAEEILKGSTTALKPVREIRQYMQCPDMTLAPATQFEPNFTAAAAIRGVSWTPVRGHTKLSELLTRYPRTRLHWIACSVRVLQKTGR
jgi:hypothetical protein